MRASNKPSVPQPQAKPPAPIEPARARASRGRGNLYVVAMFVAGAGLGATAASLSQAPQFQQARAFLAQTSGKSGDGGPAPSANVQEPPSLGMIGISELPAIDAGSSEATGPDLPEIRRVAGMQQARADGIGRARSRSVDSTPAPPRRRASRGRRRFPCRVPALVSRPARIAARSVAGVRATACPFRYVRCFATFARILAGLPQRAGDRFGGDRRRRARNVAGRGTWRGFSRIRVDPDQPDQRALLFRCRRRSRRPDRRPA